MKFTKKQIIIIGLIILAIVLIIVFGRSAPMNQKEVTLTVWGVGDSEEDFSNIIVDFKKLNPKVDIVYQQLNEATYENDLINALAANNGPDIFMFGNTWLAKHGDKVLPFDKTKISLTKLQQLFPTVVEQDFYNGTNIYALPLYIDTLATIYNKDIFDSLAIAVPPKTWLDLELLIPKLRQIDSKTNKLKRAAVAIGGSNQSIDGASDILNLLMMQKGVEFPQSASEKINFGQQGEDALNFYLQFSNPKSLTYTWDDNFSDSSLSAFSSNQVAVIFDYAKNTSVLNKQNPYLSIGIAPMMQFDSAIPSFAKYWGLAVSKNSKNYSLAQDFIIFLTTNGTNSKKYLGASGHSPALKSLIAQYQDDPILGVFASQALSARSWRQVDSDFISQTFSDMIKTVLANKSSVKDALYEAGDKINALIQ